MAYAMSEKRYLGIKECSQYIGVTKGTLYVWVCHKKIPYLKVGRLVKFDLLLIEKWLKQNAVEKLNWNNNLNNINYPKNAKVIYQGSWKDFRSKKNDFVLLGKEREDSKIPENPHGQLSVLE